MIFFFGYYDQLLIIINTHIEKIFTLSQALYYINIEKNFLLGYSVLERSFPSLHNILFFFFFCVIKCRFKFFSFLRGEICMFLQNTSI